MFLRKNQKRTMTRKEADAIIERSKTEEPLEMEKGDLKAIMIAAFMVFAPFVIAFGGALWLLYLFIFNVWAR
jgi:hypothetical protein